MRRDSYRLEVSNVAWLEAGEDPRQPALDVQVDEDPEMVQGRFRHDGDPLASSDVDVTFRFLGSGEDAADGGVLAIANRVTGEFLLEVDADGTDLQRFVTAARRYAERTDDPARYRVRVVATGEAVVDLEKRTLLVYASDGELLREHSLIPSGVEI